MSRGESEKGLSASLLDLHLDLFCFHSLMYTCTSKVGLIKISKVKKEEIKKYLPYVAFW